MTDEEKKEAAKKAEEERRENIRIRQDYMPPLACSSAGRALVPPLVTTQNRDEEFVTWVTDRGYLYVGRIDRRSEDSFIAKYRLGTKGTFSNPPAYLPPDPKVLGDSGVIYAGSSDGYVYAVLERDGELQWKFAAARSGHRFARGDRRSRLCHHRTGRHVLPQRQDRQADLVGPGRAAFRRGREAAGVCRRQVGPPADPRCPQRARLLDSLPTSAMPIKVSNGQTDRIYLATEGGIIQCLREVEQINPIVYNESRKPLPEEESQTAAETEVAQAMAAAKAPAARPAAKKPAPKKRRRGVRRGGCRRQTS